MRRPPATPLVLDATLRERIHCLWDKLAAFEAGDNDHALRHLLGGVAQIIDAQNAYWLGAVRMTDEERDPMRGWRLRQIRYLHRLPNDGQSSQHRTRWIGKGQIDEASVAHARLAGTYRARRLCDLVSADWFKSDTYQGFVDRGVHDTLVVGVPVSPLAEVYYGFLRMRPRDPFTEAERDIALYAMRGLTGFHRQVLLSHGLLVARSPLSPMERRVLALLLTDRSEKLIAATLRVSASTAHTYVRDVLRKFGVSGRNGVIALWLGRQS